jgi:hypothetical protein
MFQNILRTAAKVILAISLLFFLLSLVSMKQLYGTWGMDSENIIRSQVLVDSVDFYKSRGLRSVTLSGTADEYYTLTSESIFAMKGQVEELETLEGETAELWVDHFGRILQIVALDRTWIDFDRALNGQKIEDTGFFVLGVVIAWFSVQGIALSAITLLILRRSVRRLR